MTSSLLLLSFCDWGLHKRDLHFGTVYTTAPPSPSWHRRLRRKRAKARALLRSAFNFELPRALTAFELVLHHHGSTVPWRAWQAVSSTPAMMWFCRFCGSSNWAKRNTCYRCLNDDAEAHIASMRPPAAASVPAPPSSEFHGGGAVRLEEPAIFVQFDGTRPPYSAAHRPLAGRPAQCPETSLPSLGTALPPPCIVPGPPPAGPPPLFPQFF